jgi:hypothetical protein
VWENAFFGYLESIAQAKPRTAFQDEYNAQDGKLDVGQNHRIDAPSVEKWIIEHPPAGVDLAEPTIPLVNWKDRPDFELHVYTKTSEPDPDTGYNFGVQRESRNIVARGGTAPDDEENPYGGRRSPLVLRVRAPLLAEPSPRRVRRLHGRRLRTHREHVLRMAGRRVELDDELHRSELGLRPVRPRHSARHRAAGYAKIANIVAADLAGRSAAAWKLAEANAALNTAQAAFATHNYTAALQFARQAYEAVAAGAGFAGVPDQVVEPSTWTVIVPVKRGNGAGRATKAGYANGLDTTANVKRMFVK